MATTTQPEGKAATEPPFVVPGTKAAASPSEPVVMRPSPSSVVLPPTFANSFWTQDYKTGYESLYTKLEAGLVESEELTAHIKTRALAERTKGLSCAPRALREDGFGMDEGASLKMGLETLLSVAATESRASLQLADDLEKKILGPFVAWSNGHQGRLLSSNALVHSQLSAYEKKHQEVLKTKSSYDEACRNADASEDELKFNGNGATATPSPISRDDVSEDGVDEDNETLVGRSGGTGSLSAALGRAFSVRRKNDAGVVEVVEPNVGAALDWSKSTLSSIMGRVAGPQTGESRYNRARQEAEVAEEKYKTGVESLDSLRLVMEETLAEHFAYLQRCETDRIKAATSVLRSYQASLSAFNTFLASSNDKVTGTLALVRPERDTLSIIESRRTGPFQPRPTAYHSHYSEPSLHTFGIDLRKFDETNTSTSKIPPIVSFLLEYITEASAGLPDAERRKVWLYETPLSAQHHLRQALNRPGHLDRKVVERYDLPVVVSTLKLWLLEIEVPLIVFTQYDEFKSLYPKRVGAAETVEVPVKAISAHLARLPPVHLQVLHAIILHLATLVSTTKTEEGDEVFLKKLALSTARCVLRPKIETALTLDDRFPALLFQDLIRHHQEIFQAAEDVQKTHREERYKPRRQRTKPIDVRPSRSKLATSEPLPHLPSPASPVEITSPPLPSLPEQPTTPVTTSTAGTVVSPASSTGSNSLSRKAGGVRERSARGPRPLPGRSDATLVAASEFGGKEVEAKKEEE